MADKNKKQEIKKDISYYMGLEVFGTTGDGQMFLKDLKNDILTVLDTLMASYATASHLELVAGISTLKEKLTLLRLFTNAPTNREDAERELDRILETETPQEPLLEEE